MQIANSKNHKVWKIEETNGMKKLNLGDSRKNKDNGYDNFTWYGCSLVGQAKDVVVNESDTITINSAQMSQYKNKDGKYVPTITIFDFEVTKQGTGTTSTGVNSQGFVPVDTVNDDDIPF